MSKLYSPRSRYRLDNSVWFYRVREWNTRRGEEASSPFLPSGARTYSKHTRGRRGLLSFSAFGRAHVLEIFPFALKPSACYAGKPLVLEHTVALRSICLGMHLAHIKFVSTDVSELCFEWQITRAEQYAKEAPCVSAARARSCSLLHWNKLRERARVISQSRDFTIRRHDGNENVKKQQ